MTPTWPHGDPRAVAHAILSDRKYTSLRTVPEPDSWWDKLVKAIGDWWHWITRPLGHLTGNETVTTILGFIVLAIAVVFLIVVIVRFARPVSLRRARAQRISASALAESGDARMLFDRALAAAAAGRHREAAALLWASALRALDERGRVRYDPARTPGEWRRTVRDPNFDRLARDATVALFGDRAVDAALVARMRSSYDAVLGGA